jgi:transcriptional antiterminator Rof (Rho-off)
VLKTTEDEELLAVEVLETTEDEELLAVEVLETTEELEVDWIALLVERRDINSYISSLTPAPQYS